MRKLTTAAIVALLAVAVPGPAAAEPSDPVLQALTAEIGRAMSAKLDPAPYFIGAEVTETRQLTVSGKDGALSSSVPIHWRWADVDVRIGSPSLDSSHPLRQGYSSARGGRPLPRTDDVDLLRHVIWQEIDARYRGASESWASVQSEKQVLVQEDPGLDLAPVKAVQDVRPDESQHADEAAWAEAVRTVSATFATAPHILYGMVTFTGTEDTHWFASSEGTQLRHHESRYRVDITATAVADDGSRLSLLRTFNADTPGGLPSTAVLVKNAKELLQDLNALRTAPREEPYSGPAILSDRAAAVFFHEILGHRLEGHRLKQVDSAQTFRSRLGKRILPPFLTVTDDPASASFAGHYLRGHYLYDNQGVPTTPVTLVQNGILRHFIESRSPATAEESSNGHGRRSPGHAVVSRQGNLIVTATRSASDKELRAALIRRLKKEKLAYGLFVDEITGGFTYTDRWRPNAFKVDVTFARRIYADGRPDEVVRGLNLIGTPLESFSNVVMAGEMHEVFNGTCGAESGWVPVSAAAPSLLISRIETQRKPKGQDTPPLLPPPNAAGELVR